LGFTNITFVLSEVKNPKETLRISGPVAVGSVAVLYFLANLAYLG
jgi:amino acid transporter